MTVHARCGRPAARARWRSAARHGGCSCSTSTLRRAPCDRRCARRCACWSPAPRATRSSTGTPATACRGRSGGCRVDAIVLDNTLLVARWAPEFAARRPTFDWLAGLDALKIAFPQDEYNHAHVLDDWLADLGIDVVFSVFGPEHRELLYPRLGATARFEKCLTGYVDELARHPQRGRRAASRPPRARPGVPRAGTDAALRAPGPAQAHRRRGGGPARPAPRACASTSRPTRAMRCWVTAGSRSSRPRGRCSAARAAPARSTAAVSSWPPSAACWPSSRAWRSPNSTRPCRPAGTGSCRARSARATWRPPPRAPARCSSRAATTASLEPDVHYLPVRADFADVEAVVERLADRALRRGSRDPRLRRPRAQRPLRLRRAGRPARAGVGRGAAVAVGARPAGSLRRAQAAAAAYNAAVVRPPRWAYKAVDRVAPGVIQRLGARARALVPARTAEPPAVTVSARGPAAIAA